MLMSTDTVTTAPSRSHRVRVGLAVSAAVFLLAYLGGWFWALVPLALLLLGGNEMHAMMATIHIRPSRVIVMGFGLLMIVAAVLGKPHWLYSLLTLSIIASFFRLLFRTPRASIADIGATLLVMFYVGYLPVHFILLRGLEGGLALTVMVLFTLSVSDVAAYYAGKQFGRHPLYPALSPKKTREGALAGVVCGVAAALSLSGWAPLPVHHTIILSILVVVVGQLGDLTESLLKRDAGVKDSGQLLAGHGGILDRTDSYIFSGAASYYYIYWVVLHQGLAEDVMQIWQQWVG